MRFRRTTCALLIALTASGCSKPVEIPRGQFESGTHVTKGIYQIRTNDDSSYNVREFSVTDSTLVIEGLHASDKRYKHTPLPIVVPLADVESVSKYELDRGRSFFALVGAGAFVLFIIFVATFRIPAD